MRIGELAERTGVSVRSLRYYEEKSLLAARRTSSGQRVYDAPAVDRVILIQQLFAAGLYSDVIVELLPCVNDADGSPNEEATPWLLNTLIAERRRIDSSIRDLTRARELLNQVIDVADEELGHGDATEVSRVGGRVRRVRA